MMFYRCFDWKRNAFGESIFQKLFSLGAAATTTTATRGFNNTLHALP
jgi:hypothetical protein